MRNKLLTGNGIEGGHDNTSFLGRLANDLTTPYRSQPLARLDLEDLDPQA